MEQTPEITQTPVKTSISEGREIGKVPTSDSPAQSGAFKSLWILTLILFGVVAMYFLLTGPLSKLTRASVSGKPSQTQSMIFAQPLTMKADGVASSKIDVFISTDDGKPVPNKIVDVTTSAGVLSPSSATTDGEGHAVFSLKLSSPGLASISYSVDKVSFPQTVSVEGTR